MGTEARVPYSLINQRIGSVLTLVERTVGSEVVKDLENDDLHVSLLNSRLTLNLTQTNQTTDVLLTSPGESAHLHVVSDHSGQSTLSYTSVQEGEKRGKLGLWYVGRMLAHARTAEGVHGNIGNTSGSK